VLTGSLASRWAEHFVDSFNHPSDYREGQPRCLDFTAVFEGLLMHVRNVVEFLTKGNDPNHRCAVQFAPTWDTKAAMARWTKDVGLLNEHLSHISVKRTAATTQWSPVGLAERVVEH
jgi:hypothetical protein